MEYDAPAHFSLNVREHFNHVFQNKWIARGGRGRGLLSWSARSSDLNYVDFFRIFKDISIPYTCRKY